MARATDAIDVDTSPDLIRLVDEVRASGEPLVLRRDGKDVAVVLPADRAVAVEPRRPLTEAERRSFLATAGGWEERIDIDEFLAGNAESRHRSARPPVSLE